MSEKEEQQTIDEEIERYQSKITALDEQLADFRTKKLDKTKMLMMFKAGYTTDQYERYKSQISGENEAELSESLTDLKIQIPPAAKYVDPSPMNGERQKPTPKDPEEVGREIYQRIKHKLRRY